MSPRQKAGRAASVITRAITQCGGISMRKPTVKCDVLTNPIQWTKQWRQVCRNGRHAGVSWCRKPLRGMDTVGNEKECQSRRRGRPGRRSRRSSDGPGRHRFQPRKRDRSPNPPKNRTSMKRFRHQVNLQIRAGPTSDGTGQTSVKQCRSPQPQATGWSPPAPQIERTTLLIGPWPRHSAKCVTRHDEINRGLDRGLVVQFGGKPIEQGFIPPFEAPSERVDQEVLGE